MSDFLFVKCAIVDNLQKQGVYIAWFVHLSGDVYSVCLIKWYMWKLQLTWFVYLYFTCIELLCLIAFAKCPSGVLLQFFFYFIFAYSHLRKECGLPKWKVKLTTWIDIERIILLILQTGSIIDYWNFVFCNFRKDPLFLELWFLVVRKIITIVYQVDENLQIATGMFFFTSLFYNFIVSIIHIKIKFIFNYYWSSIF
jgi:hypothetical protein